MVVTSIVFITYAVVGLIFIALNGKISDICYNLVLYFTNKLSLKDLFIFKIDNKNRNSLYFLMRTFTISFGIALFTISAYLIYRGM